MKNVYRNKYSRQADEIVKTTSESSEMLDFHMGDLNVNPMRDNIKIGAVIGNVNIIQQKEGLRFENNHNNRVLHNYSNSQQV